MCTRIRYLLIIVTQFRNITLVFLRVFAHLGESYTVFIVEI